MSDHSKRKAVIDLGTNTFHLLIVELSENGQWRELQREREYVYLASSGMQKISKEAFDRGINTLTGFRQMLSSNHVEQYKAIGTAALRTADNRRQFINEVKNKTGIEIDVIDGLQEAKYISKGVELAVDKDLDEYLIMDIGGGSVEFIHRSENGILWEHSFALGLAVLKSLDFYKDPMPQTVIAKMEEFIHSELKLLYKHLNSFSPLPLVGASGTFEALLHLIYSKPYGKKCRYYTFQALEQAFYEIKSLDLSERLAHPGIPKERAELFCIATLLVYIVAKEIGSKNIYVSPYALKEGVLDSMK